MIKNYAGAVTLTVGVPHEFVKYVVDGGLTIALTVKLPVTVFAKNELVSKNTTEMVTTAPDKLYNI